MKKTLLASLLENVPLRVDEREFVSKAKPNPFSKMITDPSDLEDEFQEDPRFGVDDFVRKRTDQRGLASVARSYAGSQSGVYGSRFKNIVRYSDDLDLTKDTSSAQSYNDDQSRFDDDEDALYISTRDRSYKKNEFNQDNDLEDIDRNVPDEFMKKLMAQADSLDDEEMDDEFADLDPDMEVEDDALEGEVRAVKGAVLIKKKIQPDETYTEVWMYNVGDDYTSESDIKKAILSATDIDPTKRFSEDGSQELVMDTVGNVQFLTILGVLQ
jgi:hypothetical protein